MTDANANTEQIEFWNSDEARHWVTDQAQYDRMLEPFAARLLEIAALRPTERVIDIGCGTGPTTCAAARIVDRGHAHGVDISAPMIDAARSRADAQGLGNATFAVADAQTTSFAGDADVVMSRFGVMFFDDPVAAFTNLRTALDPTGRLAFVCWQDLFANEWMALPGLAAAEHVPLPDLGPPGQPGPFSLGDADRLREILTIAGFHDIAIDPFETSLLLGGHTLDDAIAFLRRTGMARALFSDAPSDAVDRALRAVAAALEPHLTPDGVRLGAATWIVTATR
jgi:SAM-dependent methyltransferase